jgi:hypothetical protein
MNIVPGLKIDHVAFPVKVSEVYRFCALQLLLGTRLRQYDRAPPDRVPSTSRFGLRPTCVCRISWIRLGNVPRFIVIDTSIPEHAPRICMLLHGREVTDQFRVTYENLVTLEFSAQHA